MTEVSSQEARADRYHAPEQLDRALHVTTPKAWAALVVLMVIVAAVLAWSLMGRVSTYVPAEGIILGRGGTIVDAAPAAGGTLLNILPDVGDMVSEGDVVADMFDAGTMARHDGAVALAEERARILREREVEAEEESALAAQNLARQRERFDELERTGRELFEKLARRLREDEALLARGIITRSIVERGEQSLDLARRNLYDVLRQRDEMEAGHLRRESDLGSRVAEARAAHVAALHEVNELAAVIGTWRVRVPAAGQVIEIRAQPGDTLEPGDPVLAVETGRTSLDVLLYVPPADGKKIEPGMPVLVSPATVKREEFGSMTGTVETISEFPASLAGMVAVLKNRELAMSFSQAGQPYAGRVVLDADPSTSSGFAWTSPQARDVNITPGTLAAIEIEVARRPPAALVGPWIKETLGL